MYIGAPWGGQELRFISLGLLCGYCEPGDECGECERSVGWERGVGRGGEHGVGQERGVGSVGRGGELGEGNKRVKAMMALSSVTPPLGTSASLLK